MSIAGCRVPGFFVEFLFREGDFLKINYVLIDYENVRPTTLSNLEAEHFRILLFVGVGQSKISLEIASALQRLGPRAEYIQLTGSGPNALDFHIAYYIGHLSVREPDAFFHIISQDKGFDPLIQHLKGRKIFVGRWCAVADIPLLKIANAKTVLERVELVEVDLYRRGSAKPKSRNALSATINALFQKQLSDDEVSELIVGLEKRDFLSIHENKITYKNSRS